MNEDGLPLRLRDSAYRDEASEPAWSREDAIEVIQWARAQEMAILGGEIWLPTTPGPTIPSPHIYQWTVESSDMEPWEDFVRRSADESQAYVEGFRWADDDPASRGFEPYFNLVLATEAEFSEVAP